MSKRQVYSSQMVGGGEKVGKTLPESTVGGNMGKEGKGKFSMRSIMRLNQLDYKMPANASAVAQRQYARSWFDKNNYNGTETAVCFCNTGGAFVDGCNSYLRFELAIAIDQAAGENEQTTVGFGQGTAANLFREIRIYSRSGVEMERIRRLNQHKFMCDKYDRGVDYLASMGTAEGYGYIWDFQAVETTSLKATFAIPLRNLSGFFAGPGGGVLIPPQLMSGLKIELEFDNFDKIFVGMKTAGSNTTGVTGISVTDMALELDTVTMADSVSRQLHMVASEKGLEYYYRTWDTRVSSIGSSDFISIESRKAASRVLMAYTMCQFDSKGSDVGTAQPNFEVDNFKSIGYPVGTRYQSRIGSLWFPNQEITTDTEAYVQTQWSFGRYQNNEACSQVNVNQFSVSTPTGPIDPDTQLPTTLDDGYGVIACTFERSNVLDISGVPVNNARTLTVNITQGSPFTAGELPDSRTYIQYVQYVRLARAFVNNVVLRE